MVRASMYLTCVLAALLTFTASFAGVKPPGKCRVVTVTEKNTRAALNVGDTLLVRLVSNPSTGYSWKVAAVDKKLLKQIGDSVMQPGPKALPGAPEHQVFKFRAIAAGATVLRLDYVRPWEKGKTPVNVYKLSVSIVKPAKHPCK